MGVEARSGVNTQAEGDQAKDAADETKQGGSKNELGLYNMPSEILLGAIKGGEILGTAFRIHEDYYNNLFTRIEMPDTYEDMSIKRVDAQGNAITTTIETRLTTATEDGGYDSENKGSINKGFIGRMVKIPIPKAAGAKLKKDYFVPKGTATTKTRKNAWVMFPKMASTRSICLWIATHIDATYLSDVDRFYMPSGTRISFDPTEWNTKDKVKIAALLGKFSTKFDNRLSGKKVS